MEVRNIVAHNNNQHRSLFKQNNSSNDIDKIFPDALRDPILRKVQFSTISRIDELTSWVFETFKDDLYPGEDVDITLSSGETFTGVVREKAKFEPLRNPDGTIQRPGFARYFVKVNNEHGDEALVDDKHIKRGRKIFTKQNLRSFLKNSLRRDPWGGAPWLVKESIALQYRLPMEIPQHLRQEKPNSVVVSSLQFPLHTVIPNLLKAGPPPPRQSNGTGFNKVNCRKGKNLTPGDFVKKVQVVKTVFQNHQHYVSLLTSTQVLAPHQLVNGHPLPVHKPEPPPKVIHVPIKYPIEDLDIAPKLNGVVRPQCKFLTVKEPAEGELRPDMVGRLLEVWNTLNVQCQFFHLDSFTFDDFLEAMKFSSEDITCELFEEVHCAVLKMIVDKEGALQVTLPDMALADEDTEESDHEESEPPTPPLHPVPAHSTRSRISQVMYADFKDPASKSPSEPRHRPHRAAEMLANNDWVEKIKAREFAEGGWQAIMVGLLYQLSLNPRQKQECDGILAHLAPMEEEPTQQTAWQHYVTLDVNKRIAALQMITLLAVSTKALRAYLEESSEVQTDIRKKKLEFQKQRKIALAQMSVLDNQRKILLPDNLPDSPKLEASSDLMDVDSIPNIDDTLGTTGTPTSDMEDDEDAIGGRSLRRANERKRKRDEDATRREREREEKEKAKMAKTNSKQSKEFIKILSEIQKVRQAILKLEGQIEECDADLREASNHRTRVLGRDRFWNRYYWFERNGMPFGGLPDASTSEYGYANGRIWVQGPDDMERLGFIEVPWDEILAYRGRFTYDQPERRVVESGENHGIRTAEDWGYYDDPEDIKKLLHWLDERGVREKALKKELMAWEYEISKHMTNLKEHLESEKPKDAGEEEPVTRMSTRHKTYVDTDAEGLRCLKWHNNDAKMYQNHLHSEDPPKPKKEKSKKAAAVAKEEKGVARPANTKPEPRQTRSKK